MSTTTVSSLEGWDWDTETSYSLGVFPIALTWGPHRPSRLPCVPVREVLVYRILSKGFLFIPRPLFSFPYPTSFAFTRGSFRKDTHTLLMYDRPDRLGWVDVFPCRLVLLTLERSDVYPNSITDHLDPTEYSTLWRDGECMECRLDVYSIGYPESWHGPSIIYKVTVVDNCCYFGIMFHLKTSKEKSPIPQTKGKTSVKPPRFTIGLYLIFPLF